MNMHIFYDENGDIKAITPSKNDFIDETCSVAIFPLSEVEEFLLGKKNISDYIIKNSSGGKFILTRKFPDINYIRTLDNYLTEIENIQSKKAIITIINQKSDKVFIVEFSENFKELYTTGSEEDKEIIENILNSNAVSIYITKKHNPYHLLFKINFLPKELFKEDFLYFNYTGIIENVSAYTKRIISNYEYREVS